MSNRIELLLHTTSSCRTVADLALRIAGSGTATAADREYLQREMANGRLLLKALAPEFSGVAGQCTIGPVTGRNWHDAILRFGQQTLDSPGQTRAGDLPPITDLLKILEAEHQQVFGAIAADLAAAERATPALQGGGGKGRKAKAKGTRGPKSPRTDPAADKRLCENWRAAKRKRTTRHDFATAHDMDVNDLIAALDRERYRRRRDAE
jgi:hypothetical protein